MNEKRNPIYGTSRITSFLRFQNKERKKKKITESIYKQTYSIHMLIACTAENIIIKRQKKAKILGNLSKI